MHKLTFNLIFTIIKEIKKNIIFRNSVYTLLIQGTNYILPLIIIPYLTRTLGKDGYGKIAFTQSFALLAGVLIEYGFALSATREIAQNRNDKDKIDKLVSITIFSKLFLSLITFFLIIPINFLIPIFNENKDLFFVSYFLLITTALNTDWFFLGKEKLNLFSINTIIGKSLHIILTLILINRNSTPVFYLIIFSSSNLITNLINLFLIKRNVLIKIPNIKDIIQYLKDSVNLFTFKLAVSLYTSANAFIIGLLLSPSQVGIFSGAEKITKAIVGLWTPLTTVIYPRINNLLKENITKAKELIKIATVFYAILSFTFTIILFLTAKFLTELILGNNFSDAVSIIKILSPIVFLVAMSNVTGILWLLPHKRDKEFNFIIMIAGVINILLGIPLTIYWELTGMAISVLLTEMFVTSGCFYLVAKLKESTIV